MVPALKRAERINKKIGQRQLEMTIAFAIELLLDRLPI
jgi:hypothetical protein